MKTVEVKKIEKFEKKMLKENPYLGIGELNNAVKSAMEFAELVKILGSYSFAVTAWRHKGGRHDDAFLDLANKIFNK
jgi:hypothetical protein